MMRALPLLFVALLVTACDEATSSSCAATGCQANKVCAEDGVCKPVVCSRHQCVDLHTEGVCFGQVELKTKACGEHQLCIYGKCQLAACQPGEFRCAPSGLRERCLTNGQGFEDAPCDEGTGCFEGACVPINCEPADNTCLDHDVLLACNSTRTAMMRRPCENGLRCSSGACRPVICEPGELGCASETHVGRCNAAGTDWSIEQLCDRELQGQCRAGQCQSRCAIEASRGASYLGCSYRPVELLNLRGAGHDEHPFAVTVGNSSDQVARVSVFEPGSVHRIGSLTWRTPVLCDEGVCSGLHNRELNGLVDADNPAAAITFAPQNLQGEYGYGAWYGAACEGEGSCRLQADAPGGDFGTITMVGRGNCTVGDEVLTGPCFASGTIDSLAIDWGGQRLTLIDAQVGGRLNGRRDAVTEGRITGLLSENSARRVIVPPSETRPRRLLAELLDPALFEEGDDDGPAGWRVTIGFTSDQRPGEVPVGAISRRRLSAWVPALGGSISATVRSQVLDQNGDELSAISGAIQQVVLPTGSSGVLLLGSDRRAELGLGPAGFRLASSVPVSAFQFNPLCCNFNYSNDASLLLPEQAGGNDFVVMSQPHFADKRGFFTVVAVDDGTVVNMRLPVALVGRDDAITGATFDETGRATLTMDRYQTLTVATEVSSPTPDLSGTRIESPNGRLLVYAGHEAVQVPTAMTAPDHLEEMIPPLETWGRSFVVPRPVLRNPGHADERTYYRLLAGPNGARVDIEHNELLGLRSAAAIGALNCSDLVNEQGRIVLAPRQVCGFGLRDDFQMRSDNELLVGQLLAGQEATGLSASDRAGDPSFSIVPPIDQLRSEYLFTVPPTYARDYVTIAAPRSAPLLLDGVPVDLVAMADESRDPFLIEPASPIGDSSWVRYTIRVGDGAHRIESTDPSQRFSVMVYAFDAFVSYAYPGGMNLSKSDH